MKTLHIVTLSLSMILFNSSLGMEKEMVTQEDPSRAKYIDKTLTELLKQERKNIDKIKKMAH